MCPTKAITLKRSGVEEKNAVICSRPHPSLFRSTLHLNLRLIPDERAPCYLAAFAFLRAALGFDAVAFFAVPAFFVIGASQQISSQVLHPQGSSTATTIPHSSQM
jgi:hypothetical protein